MLFNTTISGKSSCAFIAEEDGCDSVLPLCYLSRLGCVVFLLGISCKSSIEPAEITVFQQS